MISGKSGGSGKYSYRETYDGGRSVLVANMPEDSTKVRIVFRKHGENETPIIKLTIKDATLLWVSLSQMAKDLGWDNRSVYEMID